MPIYLTGKGPLFFAHVPKCGGSAVEDILVRRFGQRNAAFLDRGFGSRRKPWTRTSPQHADAAAIARLFPEGFFQLTIATVRHPATRLRSAFLHQRDVEGRLSASILFGDWLADLPRQRRRQPWLLDNHARRMGDMVPDSAVAFPIEHGLDPLLTWLDAALGNSRGPRAAPKRHSLGERLSQANRTPGLEVELGPAELDQIHIMDRSDYERFGYGRDPVEVPISPTPPLG